MPSSNMSTTTRQPSESAIQCPSGGQILNQSGKKSRKIKYKKKPKKLKTKKDMNLPTRLARLLKYKNAQFGGLKSGQRVCVRGGSQVAAQNHGGGALTTATQLIGRGVNISLQGDSRCSLANSVYKGFNSLHERTFGCGEHCSTSNSLKDGDGYAAEHRLIPKEKVIALDCEMVGVGPEGRTSALARCSIVDFDCNVLYDAYVKPELEILHYRTPWSGIRKHHMDDATPFREAQQQIANILQGKILVGHSLQFDIQVLKLRHPSDDIRDTSTYRGLRELSGLTIPSGQHPGLKKLTKRLFGHSIQEGEHCSVEDAKATMNLYKLVERKWEEERVSAFPDSDFRVSFMDDHFWPDDLGQ